MAWWLIRGGQSRGQIGIGRRQRSAQIRNAERQYGFVNGGDADSPNRIQCEAPTGEQESVNTWRIRTRGHVRSYVNTAYSELCLRECVLRVGINQSAHWSGPQCPYYYMHRASSRAISSISRIKRTASPWCRLFLDVHIRTPYRCVIRNGIMDTTDICNGDSLICVCNMYRIHDNIVNSLEQDRAAYTRVDLTVTYLPFLPL